MSGKVRRQNTGNHPDPLADIERDAMRWRALMRCGKIKMQGSAGVDPRTGERNGNTVHFGAEFWPHPPKPEHIDLDGGPASTAWGVACLIALADSILELEAGRTALSKGTEGKTDV